MDQRAAVATMVVVGRAAVVLVLLALFLYQPAASAADIVWGSSSTFTQQAAGGDRYLAMCESMRLGSELAFNATNARSDRMGVLASRNLVTLFLDDNRNNTATALNTNALLARSDDELLGLLVTSDGEGAATAFLSMTGQAIDTVPFVGPWSGLGLLQSPFKRWVFNTLPTSFQSLTYAIAKFLANDRLLSRFALLYPHPSLISGVDIRAGVEAKLALLGYRLASHYGVPSFSADPQTIGAAVANISAGAPQAVIMVVSSGQTSAFIKAAKAAMTRDDVIYILDGSVSNNITDDLTTKRERENVYLVFPVPLLSDTGLPIVSDFWADRDAHAPEWRKVVQPGALEGYINARWIVSVLEGMREPLNRAAFIDAVYSTPIRHVGGVAMGPFYDDCARTGCQACCNAGSRRIYLVQFPNGTLEYVPDSVLEWQSCFPQPGDVRLPFKFGESVALTGDDARSGAAVRNGLASSFGATNAAAAFNGRNMVLIGYDDQSRPEENAGSNYEQLVELDNVLALTGLRGIEAIATALNHSSNAAAPVIGVSTGSPSLNSHFNRRLVRIAGSAYEELAGALDYFVGRLGFSRVGLYYESTPDGRLTLKGLVKALALRDLSLAASVEQGDAVPTSGVELWLVYNPSGELVAPFLDSLSSSGGPTPVCVLSSLDPDLLVERINGTSSSSSSTFHARRSQAQLAMLHFTQALPNPNPNPASPAANASGTQLAASFRAALAALDPNARPGYAALSGYVSGRLLAALISTINGQVTGDSLLAALYASGVIELDDLALGVYYDRCNATGIPCCNTGSRSVHVVTPDGNANGTWSTQHTFDYDQCAFTFDSADESSDGRSREEVLGIALGVALPVAALLVCCLVLVGLVAMVASRRAAAARGLQEYTIDFDELELDGVLGQGGFGEVHKAVWKGTEVAVKLMPQGNVTREARQNFVDEVDIMSRLRHPNVILFMAASVKPPRLCIVMEYMELGSLYDVRPSSSPIRVVAIFFLFSGVIIHITFFGTSWLCVFILFSSACF
jgi:ABC-type branched-subunit amino acid transport system substrate-binding protein